MTSKLAAGFRDRIVGLRRVAASALLANPLNFRRHPKAQADALRGVLTEVGYVGALLARELPDGSLLLIDGHLRKDMAGDQDVPVLVLDVSEQEARVLLASYDPLGAMAETDPAALEALLAEVSVSDAALMEMLAGLAEQAGILGGSDGNGKEAPEDFKEYGEDLETEYCCPKCGYEWSGKPS